MPVMTRKVDSMWVSCSYPLVADAKAASDTCRGHAVTAVIEADGSQLFRCLDHQGLSFDGTTRPYSYTVKVRTD